MLGGRDGRLRNSRIGRGPTKTIWPVHICRTLADSILIVSSKSALEIGF